jgi:hypothetical protein
MLIVFPCSLYKIIQNQSRLHPGLQCFMCFVKVDDSDKLLEVNPKIFMQQEKETLISYRQWPHCTIKHFFDINEVELK